MSRISNKFFITAIDDGSTIRGILNSNKSLSQAWDGSVATPSWEGSYNPESPEITLEVTKNGVAKAPNTDSIKWWYNEAEIKFGGNDVSTEPSGTFEKLSPQKIKIIKNLASADNRDLDIIKVTGTIESNGSQIPFSASREIKIVSIASGGQGYFGQIEFVNGINNFTNDVENITAFGKLYQNGAPSNMPGSAYSVDWYVNEEKVTYNELSNRTPRLKSTNGCSGIYINKDDIVDIGSIKAVFKIDGEIVFTDYAIVDDLTDPEFLWIFNRISSSGNSSSGNVMSLRYNESITFDMWVGKAEDSTQKITQYKDFYLLLLDSEGNKITKDISGIPNIQSGGDLPNYRKLVYFEDEDEDEKREYASVTINYQTVTSAGGSITGIILAQSTN